MLGPCRHASLDEQCARIRALSRADLRDGNNVRQMQAELAGVASVLHDQPTGQGAKNVAQEYVAEGLPQALQRMLRDPRSLATQAACLLVKLLSTADLGLDDKTVYNRGTVWLAQLGWLLLGS